MYVSGNKGHSRFIKGQVPLSRVAPALHNKISLNTPAERLTASQLPHYFFSIIRMLQKSAESGYGGQIPHFNQFTYVVYTLATESDGYAYAEINLQNVVVNIS